MKKIMFLFSLLICSLSFSDANIDQISSKVWKCPYSVDKIFKGLTYVKFLNENGNPSISVIFTFSPFSFISSSYLTLSTPEAILSAS